MSYWVGMTPNFCSVDSNTLAYATDQLATIEIPAMNYRTRTPGTLVESCYYLV